MSARQPLDIRVKGEILSLAARLERTATELRRRAEQPVQVDLSDGMPDHVDHVKSILHVLAAMQGNWRLEDLVAAAAKADREALGFGSKALD